MVLKEHIILNWIHFLGDITLQQSQVDYSCTTVLYFSSGEQKRKKIWKSQESLDTKKIKKRMTIQRIEKRWKRQNRHRAQKTQKRGEGKDKEIKYKNKSEKTK